MPKNKGADSGLPPQYQIKDCKFFIKQHKSYLLDSHGIRIQLSENQYLRRFEIEPNQDHSSCLLEKDFQTEKCTACCFLMKKAFVLLSKPFRSLNYE